MNTLEYHRIFHEIKNSITLINSSMQLLNTHCAHLQSEPYWDNLTNEVTYLKNMILEISQAGNLEQLQTESLNINSLIQDICHCMNDTYPNLQWNLQFDKNLPTICADHTKLKQAILNLLKNSAEAQNGTDYITIVTQAADTNIQISIIDSGSGIPAELEDKIFDMFTTTKKQGTGLGLSIAKQIFECHNGTLLFKNNPNKGCSFIATLPVR